MAVFDHIPMGIEGLREVYQWLDDFAARNGTIAHKKSIGTSPDNHDIPAVFISNRDRSDDDKQIAIVTLARHGNEVGARVVGPEILEYLAGDDAKTIRDRQIVIVVPVVNPEGFILDQFCSSRTSLTTTERLVLGKLFREYPPDMLIDYHSLGKEEGPKYDRGDMEVIIPANTTRWAMDEQIHQHVALQMQDAAEQAGWPYEVHTLEDLGSYKFAEPKIGNMPYTNLQEKVYLLHMHDSYDNYDIPAVFISNRDRSDDDKQIAIVTLARHGNEVGARVVGPEILEYLAGDDAKTIRERQIVIVVPVVNPEGFVLDQFCSSQTSLTTT